MSIQSEVAELRAKVEALQAQVDEGGEALTPNYLTLDPTTGQTGAFFSGRIHAAGLDLDAAGVPPTNLNRIRWLRLSDGAMVAGLFGQYAPPTIDTSWTLQDPDSLNNNAAFSMVASTATHVSEVHASATQAGVTKDRLIIDSTGLSGYVKTLGGPVDQTASRPSQAQRNADVGLVGGGAWRQLPFDTILSDQDGLLTNAGGLELQAPTAGWYAFNLSCGFQNATGATQEIMVGWNSAAVMQRIPGLPNTNDAWLNATQYFSLAAGNIIQPTAFLIGAGLGWTLRGGSTMTVQRVA